MLLNSWGVYRLYMNVYYRRMWPCIWSQITPYSKHSVNSQDNKKYECRNHHNVLFITLHATTESLVHVQPLLEAAYIPDTWCYIYIFFFNRLVFLSGGLTSSWGWLAFFLDLALGVLRCSRRGGLFYEIWDCSTEQNMLLDPIFCWELFKNVVYFFWTAELFLSGQE